MLRRLVLPAVVMLSGVGAWAQGELEPMEHSFVIHNFRTEGGAVLPEARVVAVLFMPSATDLYFPVEDARYEAHFIPHCRLVIPPLLGHPAGAADMRFLNERIRAFLAGVKCFVDEALPLGRTFEGGPSVMRQEADKDADRFF